MGQLLDKINKPQDLKDLSLEQLDDLSSEIRKVLVDTVSTNGGHLASNLGVVELSIALHRVFNSPYDKIVWDVGHQSYTHKLLTGRRESFNTLRKENGISGFLRPNESEHDVVYSGHSSTSVSTALGIAVANKLKGNKNYAVAVLGDGALTGGLIYEALNNAGVHKDVKLIIVLNDNAMSISPNVGELAKYLAVIRSKTGYFKMKAATERGLSHIPLIGKPTANALFSVKTGIKNMIYKSNFFEDIGLRYMGPIDGHDIRKLCDALDGAKLVNGPVLLHINTIKGKGYDPAEAKPSEFHGVSRFDIDSGEFLTHVPSYSDKFGEFFCAQAAKDKRICAITAAMQLGTGLSQFAHAYPDRFFDIGIAEEHALPYALGLAENGMLPVFVVYSTFLQRCFDQIMHDAALQKRKMIIAIDRAGIVGDDGETHQGLYDVSFLNGIPDITVFAPSSFTQLNCFFVRALYHTDGVAAVRYPRGSEGALPEDYVPTSDNYELYGDSGAKTAIVTYGRLFSEACTAKTALEAAGRDIKIVKLNQIKPIDTAAACECLSCDNVFFFEEGMASGGCGESFARILMENGYRGAYKLTAIPDCFVEQGSIPRLLHKYKLDDSGIIEVVSAGTGNE